MKKTKELREYFISPLIVAAIVLIIFLIKGIYPFGNLSIANGDVGQSYIPAYTYFYDCIKNGKSLWFDYNLGMGSNIYAYIAQMGVYNILSFLVLLNTRENVSYMFSFILLFKLMFISFTSYILFRKINKDNKFYNVLFSLMYAFSGHCLCYNTNFMWLDVVGWLPLLLIASKYMFDTGKIYWYTIVLSIILVLHFQMAYMILLFIIFIYPVYIKNSIENNYDRKKAVFNVIVGTSLCGLLCAAFLLPVLIQVLESYRYSGGVINGVDNSNLFGKLILLVFYPLPFYAYFKWLKDSETNKKESIVSLYSLVLCIIAPIIFERINLIWHGGSYQSFPYRFSFIPILIIYIGALKFLSKKYSNVQTWKALKEMSFTCMLLAIIIIIPGAYYINITGPAFNIGSAPFGFLIIHFISGFLFLYTFYFNDNEIFKKTIIGIFIGIELVCFAYAYIGVPLEFRYNEEWSDEQSILSNEIYSKYGNMDSLYRIKDISTYLTENCSEITNIPSISYFGLPLSSVVENRLQLGYSKEQHKYQI